MYHFSYFIRCSQVFKNTFPAAGAELDKLTYQPFLLTTSRPPARGSQSSVGKGAAI